VGSGIGWPLFLISSIQSAIPAVTLSRASSSVSPIPVAPGRPGA
jgi:hypothetical protein